MLFRHTRWYSVRLEEGIIALPFKNGDTTKDRVGDVKGIVIWCAHDSVSAMQLLKRVFAA